MLAYWPRSVEAATSSNAFCVSATFKDGDDDVTGAVLSVITGSSSLDCSWANVENSSAAVSMVSSVTGSASVDELS